MNIIRNITLDRDKVIRNETKQVNPTDFLFFCSGWVAKAIQVHSVKKITDSRNSHAKK